ncbi:MAG: hypothetical protein ACK5MU_00400 [Candidatus Saccharimonadales bacterium]
MEENEKAKKNILKGVNRKIRWRVIKVAIASIVVCLLAGAVTYYFLYVRQIPLEASRFTNVRIDRKEQTINQISDDKLPYNELKYYMTSIWEVSLYANRQYYLEENSDDKTASIYFYFSQTHMQQVEAERDSNNTRKVLDQFAAEGGAEYMRETANITVEGMDGVNSVGLVTPELFHTDLDGVLKDITKVYYLVYDFDNFDQQGFDKAKSGAVLLWEK